MFTRDDFGFDTDANAFTCPNGKMLPYLCPDNSRRFDDDAREKVRAIMQTEAFVTSRRLRKRIGGC